MDKDKRFLLFVYDSFYPSGGMNDKQGSYYTLEEAIEAGKNSRYDYFHVYDRIEGVEIPFIP